MRLLFTQERVAASAGVFLDGLLGEKRRKTGWMRAEASDDPGPWASKPPPVEDEKKLPLGLRVLVILLLGGALWAAIAALVIWAL